MPILGIALSPDGTTLVTATGDYKVKNPGTVKLWDVATGIPKATLGTLDQAISAVVFSADGRTVIAGGSSAPNGGPTLKAWDVVTHRVVRELAVPPYIRSLAISPNGKYLALGTGNGFVMVLTADDWTEKASYVAHTGIVFSVAFSKDGKTLASAGADGGVKLWDAPGAADVVKTVKTK